MREVDEALSRAFARRRPRGEEASVPPPPHILARPPRGESAHRYEPEPVVPQWPGTVQALGREHGDRFLAMANALIEARDRQGAKVLLFTSCHRAEGRSTLILALARALATLPGRTLLLDADLSGPMLARMLGLRPALGLDDVVEKGHAIADALVPLPAENLTLLPLRLPVAHPRTFLGSPAWSRSLAGLRRDFDLILLDGGPLFVGLSAAALHRSVDAAVLVQNRSLTGDRALERAREALDAAGIPVLGLAQTFSL